eukprot:GHVP01014843.1.p1 GENE.GHVP01014843.1~~GHVP01014843.1.p1  ORF type:complete len:116 (-),score=10.96 GHVP01014843.1:999-1346(-)
MEEYTSDNPEESFDKNQFDDHPPAMHRLLATVSPTTGPTILTVVFEEDTTTLLDTEAAFFVICNCYIPSVLLDQPLKPCSFRTVSSDVNLQEGTSFETQNYLRTSDRFTLSQKQL